MMRISSSRLHRASGLAFALLLAAGMASAQTVLSASGSSVLRLSPDRRIVLCSHFADASFVVLLPKAGNPRAPANADAVMKLGDGRERAIDLGGPVFEPFVARGEWIFVSALGTNNAPAGRVLNVLTGTRRDIALDGHVFSAAISPDYLAVLTAAVGQAKLAVYRLDTGMLTGASNIPAASSFTFLSFASADRLLAIDWSEPAVTEVDVAFGHVNAGMSRRLQGPEVERSLARKRTYSQGGREKLVLAHLIATNNNSLFFLAPFSRAEGFRLVEFDHNWQQVASYRLLEDKHPATRIELTRNLVSSDGERIYFLRPDGVLVEFCKPDAY